MDSEGPKSEESQAMVNNLNSQLPFPDEVLEKVLSFIDSHKDRNSVSLVRKDWYNAERWTRQNLFIGNCYSVSPEIVARRFPRIKSLTLKGKPRFSDFNMLPHDWGANVHSWLLTFAQVYPFLEELRLKRMIVTDESLDLLAKSFPSFKCLSLWSCDGFSEKGLKAIVTHCRYLTELDIQESISFDIGGGWLSCFPETLTSLEVLNFSSVNSAVNFEDLESLISRCKSLRVLKVNETITIEQLRRLLALAPGLVELGAGSFQQELTPNLYRDIQRAINDCKQLQIISGLWGASTDHLPVLYGACAGLSFLNLSDVPVPTADFVALLAHCPNLTRLWISDTVEDEGLAAVGSKCPLIEELRVFPAEPFEGDHHNGVTEVGFLAVSRGCRKLRYVLYFCQRMTNAAVATVVQNCPDFTHFRLCIMTPRLPDHVTNGPMDEGFGAVVKTCRNLRRLSVSGLLTDLAFEYIGKYAKNLETLSVAFAGNSDRGMQCVLGGCPKLRKLEIRDCPFGNAALLSKREKYENMRSLWMSTCYVTMKGCRLLAREMPRLNVEVIAENGSDDSSVVDKVYVYRSVAGRRRDAPPSVVTL
ncbi:protein TRANSPORT INHIBITOR RESPONSE 1-like [Andrographis paniculata]|uniref:protein TRANSPORT INHIBITOR RESPONSE 1-like n=1 Tax=Andrographis paniculata TaxID=175694 RepID=UPI0021E8152E|nr:protein TRANSPORT INHIBITOR RESPONSE 1-like [Andrographis paniculata]XP_051128866.1 protein TRANSPORT INHIBITOR RESPONSE 1-like [Andrographis paniculata]XP_051128867.1 protein TRANSPORT INHIBITOR RESPONSE 1-like [Andrographis paniculata]